jgi:single-stranded-DNA-specific exonuclease
MPASEIPNEMPIRLPRRWVVCPPAPSSLLARHAHLPPLVVQLLYNRGVTTGEQIDDFLACRLRGDDPFGLADMAEAVARIQRAIAAGEKIVVFGDFDADGVTATAVLVQTLRRLGAQVEPYIPHRVDEGYGVSREALALLAQRDARLIITVDCGIRSADEVAFGRQQGLDIIVTDHHTIGERLPPALACINPRRPDSAYPFRELSGAGVAYKLAQALLRSKAAGAPTLEEELLDLVALGTVADLVPLVGENRALVSRGMARLNQPARLGVMALISNAGLRPGNITATDISFILAPRLNAAGRLDSAHLAYDLLTATDASEAGRLAYRLGQLNRQRQRLTAEAFALAQAGLPADVTARHMLFLIDGDVLPGIIGLVAGQLAEAYYRPAVVVCRGERHSRGSARSIPEFHITRALDECSAQGLLVRHGGHAAAAGFTVETERLDDLQQALSRIAARELAGQDLTPALTIDAVVDLQTLDWAAHALLSRLEPFGYGNSAPVLASYGVEVLDARQVGAEGKHLKITLGDGRQEWDAIAFRMGPCLETLTPRIDVAYRLEANLWNGRLNLQLNVEDFRPAE